MQPIRVAETFIPHITVEVILKEGWETLEQFLSIKKSISAGFSVSECQLNISTLYNLVLVF